jgi:hypothetical protein
MRKSKRLRLPLDSANRKLKKSETSVATKALSLQLLENSKDILLKLKLVQQADSPHSLGILIELKLQ